MGVGAGIFLVAVGAILKFAVTRTFVGGINLATVGVILMIAGAVGVLFDLLIWGPSRRRTTTTVVDDAPPASPARNVYPNEEVQVVRR